MVKFLFIGLGGFLGSIGRYWISTLVYKTAGESFPYGTLTVNIVGSLIIGIAMTLLEERFLTQPELRLFVIVGILGGFTTFSSFSFETVALMKAGNYLFASVNVVGSVIVCLAATWAGTIIGKLL